MSKQQQRKCTLQAIYHFTQWSQTLRFFFLLCQENSPERKFPDRKLIISHLFCSMCVGFFLCLFFFFNPVPSFHLSGLWHLKLRQIQISTVRRHAWSYFGTVRDRQLKRWNEAAPSPRGSDGAPPEHQATPLSSGKDVVFFFLFLLSFLFGIWGYTKSLTLWLMTVAVELGSYCSSSQTLSGFFLFFFWCSMSKLEANRL